MADLYLDLGANMFAMFDNLRNVHKVEKSNEQLNFKNLNDQHPAAVRKRRNITYIDPRIYEVRHSICVAGVNRDAVSKVKSLLDDLMTSSSNSLSSTSTASHCSPSFVLESFHVKGPGDVKDGALLVPKIVLAASHCAGLKLIDESERNEGQLDYLYDEICDIGADVLLIYINLPRAIYAPNRSFVYHQRISELLFPDQPVLLSLALNNTLVTLSENATGFNHVQRNVVREWLSRPVDTDCGVYRTAAGYLTEAETQLQASDAAYWSETELDSSSRRSRSSSRIPRGLSVGWAGLVRGFASSAEIRGDGGRAGGNTGRRKKRKSYGLSSRNGVGGAAGGDRSDLKPLLESYGAGYDAQELSVLNDAFDDELNQSTETMRL